jgi:hypothetical protein
MDQDGLRIVVATECDGGRRHMILLEQVWNARKFFLESRDEVNEATARAAELQGKLSAGRLTLQQVVVDRQGIKMIKWSEV